MIYVPHLAAEDAVSAGRSTICSTPPAQPQNQHQRREPDSAFAVAQAFAHPQARFLYEKMWQTTLTRGSLGGRLTGGINYVSYAGIHCAMAMGVVSSSSHSSEHGLPVMSKPHHLNDAAAIVVCSCACILDFLDG